MKFCLDCKTEHDYPPMKFEQGEKVKLIAEGSHHNDLVGQIVTIEGVFRVAETMPCDENEYFIVGRGFGAIGESRFEKIA